MNEDVSVYIELRILEADRVYSSARKLLAVDDLRSCANRLYYAAFYLVSAMLATKQLSSKKHSGVRAHLHRSFVKTGEISKSSGRLYDRMFNLRMESDYILTQIIDRTELEELMEQFSTIRDEARSFLKARGYRVPNSEE